jgi:hypothetical protein
VVVRAAFPHLQIASDDLGLAARIEYCHSARSFDARLESLGVFLLLSHRLEDFKVLGRRM